MDVYKLTQALIAAAEKGATIARAVRAEDELLSLLIQEKKGIQKNDRFVNDFKTLADVLVQETVRHDLSQEFPSLGENFHGEESNKFTNTVGESILVEIKSSEQETSSLLEKILDGASLAAELLSKAVHTTIPPCNDLSIKLGDHSLPEGSVGVWIDPIDSTSQYINGENGVIGKDGLAEQGLQNVLVLIGLYDIKSGQPLIGVVNQPFHQYDKDTNSWTGHSVWGISVGKIQINSLGTASQSAGCKIVLSSSEDEAVQSSLREISCVTHASGAGYKILVTVLGLVDAYVISKSSTYKWDVCGPHAIMKTRGGGVVSYSRALQLFKDKKGAVTETDLDSVQVGYTLPDSIDTDGVAKSCNQGGIIVYSKFQFLWKVLQKLSTL